MVCFLPVTVCLVPLYSSRLAVSAPGVSGPLWTGSTSLPSSKSVGSHSLPAFSRFPDPFLSLCLTPFPGFLSGSDLCSSPFSVCVSLSLRFCVARFRRSSRASPPLQINKPSPPPPPPPPLSQGGGAGDVGRADSLPSDATGKARGPIPGWPDSAGPGAETEGAPRGVLGCSVHVPPRERSRYPLPAPRADPTPRTRGLASPAGASGALPRGRALEGRRTGPGVFTSLLHFLSTASVFRGGR